MWSADNQETSNSKTFSIKASCDLYSNLSFLLTAASDRTKYSLQRGKDKLCVGTVKIYIRYSGVRFHIFYCNSAGLSDVFRYNGVFVIAGFHCTREVTPSRLTWANDGGLGPRLSWALAPSASVTVTSHSSADNSTVMGWACFDSTYAI